MKGAIGSGLKVQCPPAKMMGQCAAVRLPGVAVERADRNARQIQHIQDVGIGEFKGEREAPSVVIGDGRAGFQREERNARPARIALSMSGQGA